MATDASGFDQYQRVQIQGVSSVDDSTPTNVHVDPVTNELLVQTSISGTVTVTGGLTDAELRATPVPVSGTVTANLSATDNTVLDNIDQSTDATETAVESIDSKTPALGQALAAASVPVVLTAAQLTTLTPPAAITGYSTLAEQQTQTTHLSAIETATEAIQAGQLPDGHNVTIDNASIAVTGTFWQATQPIEPDGTALSNNQVSVDTTVGGVTILAASAGRAGVMIKNEGSSITCWYGTGTVSTSNGQSLKPGESAFLPTDSEVKAITGSSSTTVSYVAFA